MLCHWRSAVITVLIIAAAGIVFAQDPDISLSQENPPEKTEKYDEVIAIKIPDDFSSDPLEEPGIFKWKKDNAEIYIIVGELFSDSAEKTYSSLLQAAQSNSKIEEVRELKISNGRAFVYKEKPTDDSDKLQMWRLVAIADNKTVNIDFTAPSKEFTKFAQDFTTIIESFSFKKP